MSDSTLTGPRAGRREWLGLAVLALPTLVVSIDITALFLALPHLSVDLDAGATQQLWIMDSYGFMIAGFLVTMGTLGDRIGRRKLLLIGAAAFGVLSVLAAYSTSAEMLIVARVLLGIAGATLMPSTLALISNMFLDARQRATAIAAWASCLMGGGALGPVVGGLLLEHFWWGSVFLLGVPVMALLLIAGPALLPEYRDPGAGRLDLTSVVLALAAILPVVYGMKEVARDGWRVLPVAAVVFGLAIGYVFVRRQRNSASPLLDLRLFASRPFSAGLIILLVGAVVLGGYFLPVSQFVQSVKHIEPGPAGLLLAPAALSMAVGSALGPVLLRWMRPNYAISAGLVVSAAGFVLLALIGTGTGLWVLVVSLIVIHLGAAPMFALGTDLVVGSAPPERAGSAASMSETGNELGVALGIAVIGSIATAVYRGQLGQDTPEPVRESIAGATATAADDLLARAGEAFTAGMSTVAVVCAVAFAALAAMAATLLRQRKSST